MLKISPSILASDFGHLADEFKKVEDAGVEYIHIDVMDGVFVPNISLGPCIISAVRPTSNLVFDVHLMITDPIRYVEEFKKAGADIITIHYEACENQVEVLKRIRELGCRAGISIKPATPAFVLEPLLEYIDLALVMSVEPGFGGQSFIPETLESVRALRGMIDSRGLDIEIEIDGGIGPKNIYEVTKAGVDVAVAGSSIYKAADVKAAVQALRDGAYKGEAE
ncbi:MAG: ribulose-phosphate 3-epimerase [Clostridia bacterium]|nr:ribulose-phosphate 3-epimerase [Clostridia bacterium]MBQ4574508.1 ribulose-phosphate 3-epimerase [Clostridia bacterium]